MTAFFLAEVGLRLAGFADMPIVVPDRETGYLFAPFQPPPIATNRWSMRSPDMRRSKAPGEVRVLVLGDSVPNGANLARDQLATSIMPSLVHLLPGEHLTVGNVSMGGWSPPNLLGYVSTYGWFEADVAIFVLNSEDMDQGGDVRWPVELGPGTFTGQPSSAIFALLRQAILRRIGNRLYAWRTARTPRRTVPDDTALSRLLQKAKRTVPHVAILYHPRRVPQDVAPPEALTAIAQGVGVTITPAHYPDAAYSDRIHLNSKGQEAMAGFLAAIVNDVLNPTR